MENFKKVMQLPDYTPILDVKMVVPTEGWSLVLAITDSKLYQFAEETAFGEVFADKVETAKNLEKNVIHFDSGLLP